MDSSAFCWISEMGLDSSIFTDECDFMESLDEELAAVLGQDLLDNCLSNDHNNSSTLINSIPSTNSVTSLLGSEPPHKLQKPNNFSNFSIHNNTQTNTATTIGPNNNNNSEPILLNFGYNNSNTQDTTNTRALNPDEEAAVSQVLNSQVSKPTINNNNNSDQEQVQIKTVKKTSRVRPPSQTYDHIIAERKRREQLSQRFVALSTIVPGLKKMDKTSVLGDAIKYLKQLQERVKTLEEQATRQTMESVVLVRKSQMFMAEEDEGSSGEESGTSDEQPLPEIEARVCNNHILVRVHCEKQKGVLVNLLSKIEGLNLVVINTNVIPFGTLSLDITVIAEMEKDFCLTVKDVVRNLRAALRTTTTTTTV